MNTILICCETLKNEVNKVFEITGKAIPSIWVSSEYHLNPLKLRDKLQWEINQLSDYERVLLGYGRCGNAVIGLSATTADLIIPRADDCIDILLSRKNVKCERSCSTYFLSKGWLQNTENIIKQYNQLVERYGQGKAGDLMRVMLHRYYFLMFIDTGVSQREELNHLLKISEKFASDANLKFVVKRGSFWLLEALLQDLIDKNFITIKKGETVTMSDFMLNDSKKS